MGVTFSMKSVLLRSRLANYAAALAAFALTIAAALLQAQLPEASAVRDVSEVVETWQPAQHLYVKGDLGVSPQQLSTLEGWLDEHAPHWTVVLLESADGESYGAPDGRTFFGMDAVEYALGHGLANQTGFGRLEHPRTGETDGAVFVLFLRERKFSYYGSDAQDRRELGESRWVGSLDRDAIDAMRNGGRIVDAVKNTVGLINRRLDKSIADEERAAAEEQERARRAQLERQRVMAATRERAAAIREKLLKDLAADVEQFCRDNPAAAAAPLANPPVERWQKELVAAELQLTESSARATAQKVESVAAEIEAHRNQLAAHRGYSRALTPIRQRWDNIAFNENSAVADAESRKAEELLARAESEHAGGNPAFTKTLAEAVAAIEQGEAAIVQETERLATATGQRRAVRRALGWTGGGLLALLGGLLGIFNWRRRPALRRAFEAFEKSSAVIGHEQQQLDDLAKRVAALFPADAQGRDKAWTGTTREVADSLQQQMAGLQALAGEGQRVLDRAAGLLNPGNPLALAANMVSSSRYLTCSNLLVERSWNRTVATGSTTAQTTEGLSGNRQEKGSGTDSLRRLRETVPDPGGWANLTEFIGEWARRRELALAAAERLEQGLIGAPAAVQNLHAAIAGLTEHKQKLQTAARGDGYFALPALEKSLLPAAQVAFNAARSEEKTDPVRVIEEISPPGLQQLADGKRIAEATGLLREQVFPQLDAASDRLRELGRNIGWIEQEVRALGERADRALQQATSGPATDATISLESAIRDIGSRATRSAELAAEIRDRHRTGLTGCEQEVKSARERVASRLKLAASASLSEAGQHPGERLESAARQLVAAESALDRGDPLAATQAIAAGNDLVQQARQLVTSTESALDAFPTALAAARQHHDATAGRFDSIARQIETATSQYAATALVMAPLAETDDVELVLDPAPANIPLSQLLDEARAEATARGQSLGEADQSFRAGRVLEASAVVQQSEAGLHEIDGLLLQLTRHCESLDATSRASVEKSGQLAMELQSFASPARDSRCEQSTIELHAALVAEAATLASGLGNRPVGRDPFADAGQVARLEQRFESLRATVESDFAAFAQAGLAVRGAEDEQEAVYRLVDQSQRDQIPDSATIARCAAEAKQLGQRVAAVRKQFQQPHTDWQAIQTGAARLNADLGVVAGTLVRELQLAGQAAEDFRNASAAVFRAARWTGAHGVSIHGEPGSAELEQARRVLAGGDYQGTIDNCRAAAMLAADAIRIAELAVEHKRRELAAAAEAARQAARSHSSSWGSGLDGISIGGGSRSGGGSFGGGRSWSSGSSGGSSSRSSGGGSGFSRSGW